MDKATILNVLIATVAEIQAMSGEDPTLVSPNTVPLTELPGFDSIRALEVICAIEVSLGRDLSNDNLFLAKDHNRTLSIDDVADMIVDLNSKFKGGKRERR